MERLYLPDWRALAKLIEETPRNTAYALGVLRQDLPDFVPLVRKRDPKCAQPGSAARSKETISYDAVPTEHSTLEAPSREFGEEAFDGVEPGRRGRREVKRPAGMPGQPFLYLGMFVCRVVVDDGVDRHSHRHLRLGGVEEADELLVPVALHVAADDGAVEHIEGGNPSAGSGASLCHGVCSRGSSSQRGLLHRQTGAVVGVVAAPRLRLSTMERHP